MANFGSTPGVQVNSTSGTVQGVSTGRDMYLILVGNGDNAAGSASTNTVKEITSRTDAENLFGADTDIVKAYNRARAGGASSDHIKAIMTQNTDQTESFTATASGTLSNTPVIPDAGRFTVDQVNAGNNDITVEFTFDASPTAPSSTGVRVNPHTGDWIGDTSDDYDFKYDTADWSTASNQLSNAVRTREFGLVHPLTSYEGIISDFENSMLVSQSGARDQYKMLMGAYTVQYTGSNTDLDPQVDTASYTNSTDTDITFLLGPAATENYAFDDPLFGIGNSPYYAGKMASLNLEESIFNEDVTDADPLAQKLSPADISNLRNQDVIPVSDLGVITLKDNQSTYDQSANGGYTRDWFTMRIHDDVVATVQHLGEQVLGLVNNQDTRDRLGTRINNYLTDLEKRGLLVPGGQQVEINKKASDEIEVDMAVQPQGVTKKITVNLTIQP